MDKQHLPLLGKNVGIPLNPDRSILCGIDRSVSSSRVQYKAKLEAMHGFDLWNCYEFSWLNSEGFPNVAICQIVFSSDSEKLVESKSLKLYLGSYYNTKFNDRIVAEKAIMEDLASLTKGSVTVKLFEKEFWAQFITDTKPSSTFCLDTLTSRKLLSNTDQILAIENENNVEERVYTDLFRSVCPVTGQPDWASVEVHYRGKQLSRASLLSYLLGFREHGAFHEEVCEQIYFDILNLSAPDFLLVRSNFLRRGGIDINPVRYSPGYAGEMGFKRGVRQ